ncbi:hypothetical protein Tco_0127071 [Tanacetum coccineum]
MTTLQFADTHNLVAFLSKPAESEGVEQIATVKVKTVNGEVKLQALVDGKKIIVTEASVRRDLQLNDEEGMDYSLNATIFEELTRLRLVKKRGIMQILEEWRIVNSCCKYNMGRVIFKTSFKHSMVDTFRESPHDSVKVQGNG